MKRTLTIVALCAILVLCTSFDANAQGRKKKGKEPELAICKRGKLIFEDDFSGKELETWFPYEAQGKRYGEWGISKGALCTKSKTSSTYLAVKRDLIPEVRDIIVQFMVNMDTASRFGMDFGWSDTKEMLGFYVAPKDARFEIVVDVSGGTRTTIAGLPLRYSKREWLAVSVETIGERCAFSVEGRTVQGENKTVANAKKRICFLVWNQQSPAFLIDDVRVYEALPKDEGDDKDDKNKKKK